MQSDDPCLGKWLNEMNDLEKMYYYSELEYDQVDYLAECEVPMKKNGKVKVQ